MCLLTILHFYLKYISVAPSKHCGNQRIVYFDIGFWPGLILMPMYQKKVDSISGFWDFKKLDYKKRRKEMKKLMLSLALFVCWSLVASAKPTTRPTSKPTFGRIYVSQKMTPNKKAGVVKLVGPTPAMIRNGYYANTKVLAGAYSIQITPPPGFVLNRVVSTNYHTLKAPYRQQVSGTGGTTWHISYKRVPPPIIYGTIYLVQTGNGQLNVAGPISVKTKLRYQQVNNAKVGFYTLNIKPPKGHEVLNVADVQGTTLLPPYRQEMTLYGNMYVRYHVSYRKRQTYQQLHAENQKLRRKLDLLRFILKRMTHMNSHTLDQWKEGLSDK